MRLFKRVALIVTLMCSYVTPTLADTHYVSKTGSNSPPYTQSATALQVVSVKSVSGLFGTDSIVTGQVIEIRISITNFLSDGIVTLYNPFKVYSPTGGYWTQSTGNFSGEVQDATFSTDSVELFSANGSVSDTVAFWGGGGIANCGLPPNFEGEVYTITLGPIPPTSHGHTICLDTVASTPTHSWLWYTGWCDVITGTVSPDWIGPRCYTVVDTTLVAVSHAHAMLPEGIKLPVASPNPFNASTKITYSLRQPGTVTLTIFDVLGRHVNTLVDGVQTPGEHSVMWHGKDTQGQEIGSGVYFYRLSVGGEAEVRKMVVVK